MTDPVHERLAARVRDALAEVAGRPDVDPQVRPCANPEHGDYQSNAAMGLAKELRRNPREIAQAMVDKLDLADLCEPPTLAGPGFLNLRLRDDFLASQLGAVLKDDRLGVPRTQNPRTVVVDYSSPNVAKPMHVGHIRSTVIGDCLARMLRARGHTVIADNHLGDWGTQFGKILVGYRRYLDQAAFEADPVGELERLYKLAHEESERDEATLTEAREALVRLQAGDPEPVALWEKFRAVSQQVFDRVYERLGVRFDVTLGESFYNPQLSEVVQELIDKGLAEESEGALCVFFRDDPELADSPCLIRKRDGAALYATTDLATIQYRMKQWRPSEIVYVTDARQQLHFKQLFAVARRWGVEANLRHVYFGTILGEDNKPIKTRSGEPIKLSDLLDEAEARAYEVACAKNADLSEDARREVARIVGLGAVKYADLSQNRVSDYVFSWDKMLSMTGNTAPYLQYSYVRIRSIFRRGGAEETDLPDTLPCPEPAERTLGLLLLRLPEALDQALDDYRPNMLCTYLYDLAAAFTSFYEQCPVLQAEPEVRRTRLALCQLTATVLKQGLGLLGIEVSERM
jgi:arginyl-tRNA synthetase